MDKETTFCKITQNDQSFGQCDIDTSANIINNEDKLNLPATYYMSEPNKTNPNGSIAVEETRRLLDTGFYDGAAATLAESRLYSFYKPIQKELFEKEQQYKKLVFDNSSFINRFGKDYMMSKYNLERSQELYKMNKAQQEQDFNAVLEHKYRIEDLNKKLSAYSQPEEGFVNSSANVLASMARNAPEMIGVAVGAGVVTAATGGTGLPAYLATAGATVLEGAIIYNDTYDIEAGDMLENLADKNMTLDQKLAVAEDYANISALIEASGSIFGLAGMGGRAITKGATKIAGKGLKKTATQEAKKEIIDSIVKKGIGEKLKDPQYLAFIGKKMGEHIMSATGEGAQEVTQSMIQDAFVKAIDDGENPENIEIIKNIWKVLGDNSKTSQYGALFANTALASLFIAGGTSAGVQGVKTGYQKLLARSMQGMNAQQISEQIIEMKKNSTAYGKSPKAYGENTQAITEAGNAPEQVTIDANKVLDVLDEAEKKGNTELLEQLKNLKITRENLEKAVEGVGHIKIDFKEFDDVVLDPNNGELFQKIKGDYTFDETTMTAKEVVILVEQMKMKRPELAMAEADPQSVFNTVMNGLSKNKNFTPRQVVHNAVLAQVMANRASTFEGGEIDSRKIAFDLINVKESFFDKAKKVVSKVKEKVVKDKTKDNLDKDVLFQKTEHISGAFSKEQGQNIIRLTEAANPTTFVHEFNHLIINDMLESFNGVKMTEYWKKETMKIAKFVGAELKDGKLQFTEAQFEKVAYAFQTYIKEGKAPVEGLQGIFNRMMEWFIDVYKKLTMSDVKLNKSIRSAFDALLVSKEEMDQAIIDKNLRAIGRRPGMSEAEYQAYLSDLSELNRVSTNKHIEAMRKKARTAIEENNQKKLAEIKATISAELDGRPDYKFRADVMTKKINKADIPSEYKLKNPGLFTKENGVPLEQFLTDYADVVSNAADVVQLLNNLEPKEDIIERESAEQFSKWLNEQYPELAEVDAKIAAANDKLIRVRVKEYMMLHKIPMSMFNQYYNELVRAGEEEIQSMSLRELVNIEKMQDLETKIVTKARFAKTDSELANSLWHQAALNYILMRSKDIRVQVNRFNKHFDKYRYLPNENALKKIDAYDFDMITAVLNNFGFTHKKPRVRDVALTDRLYNWINGKLSGGFTDANLIREYVPTLGQPTESKFDKNNYHNFSVINTVIRFIENASQAEKIQTETDKRLLRENDAKDVIDFQINKNIDANAHSWWVDNVVMKEQFLKKIFPEKIFVNYVLPFVNSMSLREQRIEKNDALLADGLKNTVANRKKVFSIQLSSGQLLNMTYEEMQVAVLNIDNMETWIASWNAQKNVELNESDFLSIIEQAPQQMIEDAQKVWNVFDSQKAEFREAQYKIDGFLMDYVEPRKITLSDGREIQSGYFPRGKIPTAEKEFSNMVMSFNNNGVYSVGIDKYAKDRLTKSHKNLDLSINSIRSWLYHTATVIEIAPHHNKLSKLINNDILKQTMSGEINKTLNDWMSYSVTGDNLNKFYSTLDLISSVQILGWEPIKMVVQALGFIPSMAEVGIQWIAPQLLKMSTYGNMFNVQSAMELSPYMRDRFENAANYIASIDESNQLIRSGKTIADKLMNIAMWFTVHGDAFASYIVWNGAYEKALAQGKTENDAVLLADSAVRTSQGDSTTVSRPKLLQGNQRFFTKFASYFIAMNSRISSAIIGRDRLEAVSTLMLAGVIGPIAESMLRSLYEWGIGSDDDKDKWRKKKINSFEDLFYYNTKQNISGSIGATLVPVAGAGSYAANLLTTGQAYNNQIAMLDYLYTLQKVAIYPIRATYAETEQEKQKYLKQAKSAALKSLTIPNKWVKKITE